MRWLAKKCRTNIRRTLASKLGLDPSYHKIFAIGFAKTATTSIDAVFRECGLMTDHGVQWRKSRDPFFHWAFQGFSDGAPDSFERLDRRFPNSRFILNTRDLGEWLDSRLVHNATMRAKRPSRAVGKREISSKIVENWTRQRNEYHARVLTYFQNRPQDFLIVNYIRNSSASEQIARFIGSSREVTRPHAFTVKTDRQQGELRYAAMIEEALGSLGVPKEEWNNDLLCPSLGIPSGLPVDTREL